MSAPPISPPSPLTDMLDEEFAPTAISAIAPPPPAVLPLTDFELEVRRRLSIIESHQARSDALVMELQGETRTGFRRVESTVSNLASKVGELVTAVRQLVGNGHG